MAQPSDAVDIPRAYGDVIRRRGFIDVTVTLPDFAQRALAPLVTALPRNDAAVLRALRSLVLVVTACNELLQRYPAGTLTVEAAPRVRHLDFFVLDAPCTALKLRLDASTLPASAEWGGAPIRLCVAVRTAGHIATCYSRLVEVVAADAPDPRGPLLGWALTPRPA
jgi:hypothetical protein